MDKLIDAEDFRATFFGCPAPDPPTMEELSVITNDQTGRVMLRILLPHRDAPSSHTSFGGNGCTW